LLPLTYRSNLKFLTTTAVTKIRKAEQSIKSGVVWGDYGSLKVIGNVTDDFLFDFNRNGASILCRFRDLSSYLWKVANFNPPHFIAVLVELRLVTDRQTDRQTQADSIYRAGLASRSKNSSSSSSTVELVDNTYTTLYESWLFTTSRSAVTP